MVRMSREDGKWLLLALGAIINNGISTDRQLVDWAGGEDKMIDAGLAYEFSEPVPLREIVGRLGQQISGFPINNKDGSLVDLIAAILAESGTQSRLGKNAIKALRSAILVPDEQKALKLALQQISCAKCGNDVSPGQLVSIAEEGNVICTRCDRPLSTICQKCKEVHSIDATTSKRISGFVCSPCKEDPGRPERLQKEKEEVRMSANPALRDINMMTETPPVPDRSLADPPVADGSERPVEWAQFRDEWLTILPPPPRDFDTNRIFYTNGTPIDQEDD